MTATLSYPVRVEARMDPHLSRWLWLVKWVLIIPHHVARILAVTGRYPEGLYSFILGLNRWVLH